MRKQSINLFCKGNVFVKYQAQVGVKPEPPLRTPLATTINISLSAINCTQSPACTTTWPTWSLHAAR